MMLSLSSPRITTVFLLVAAFVVSSVRCEKPNIVIILADDLGFNDVSFRRSNWMITKNIDALAYNGIILDKFYTANMCSPSRASLLTGKFPLNTGIQVALSHVLNFGLPPEEILMPQVFKEHNYSTALIGKWHLGSSKESYLPTSRGFDEFHGYYGGWVTYFNYTYTIPTTNYTFTGYDSRTGLYPTITQKGRYATEFYTEKAVEVIHQSALQNKPFFLMLSHLTPHNPLEAPQEILEKFNYIKDVDRRKYAAMLHTLDESVGQVVKALSDTKVLENTIIMFLSDNGAKSRGSQENTGSNYPLRGQKYSPWEGAVRVPAVIYSPLLKSQQQKISDQVFHLADLLPTFAHAAGIEVSRKIQLDGINLWEHLASNKLPVNREIVHNIDDFVGYVSFMDGDFKYVKGVADENKYYNFVNGPPFNITHEFWISDEIEGLRKGELDPTADNYERIILESDVNMVLKGISGTELTEAHIKRIRSEMEVRCSGVVSPCQPGDECLFNIKEDPCEKNNIAAKFPELITRFREKVEKYRRVAPPNLWNGTVDHGSDPRLHEGFWGPWLQGNAPGFSKIHSLLYLVVIFAMMP